MPIRLSYINARGQEAVLDDDEGTFAHELAGRDGFEFPSLKLKEHEYGDGTTDIVSITLKNRSVTCYFWADPPDIPHWEEKFNEVKGILLQTGLKEKKEWGKLRIRMEDGHYVYLNCVYEKGLDDIVRDIGTRIKFSLTFKASDPYFYNGFEYAYVMKQDDRSGYLFLNNAEIVDTLAEAQSKSGGDKNLFYKISSLSRVNPNKYYVIIPKSQYDEDDKTIFMRTSKICETKAEAIQITNEPEINPKTGKVDTNPIYHPHWWVVNFETTEMFSTKAEAQAYTGVQTEGTKWWSVEVNGVMRYQARKTETKYYAINPKNALYMRSSNANTIKDLYIHSEKVYPTIIINGPAENIKLVNNDINRKIEFSTEIKLDVNEQIQIITTPLKRKVTQHLKTMKEGDKPINLIPWMTADSTLDWWLGHGSNDVEFTNSATTPESYIKFLYTERYSGAQ